MAWHSKKQTLTSLSTAEEEYIATGSCCPQLLWVKQMLSDYGIEQGSTAVFCVNQDVIDISKNPIPHSMTKHIDNRHHFIRELVEENILSLEHIPIEHQLANIFTKPLDTTHFCSLCKSLGISLHPDLTSCYTHTHVFLGYFMIFYTL